MRSSSGSDTRGLFIHSARERFVVVRGTRVLSVMGGANI